MLAVLLVAPLLSQIDATIANVATPSIHTDLGASGAALELIISGYLISFAALLTIGARLGQTHGYKRLFLAGLSIFSLASLACGLAPGPGFLIAARVVQGAGAALMFPQTLTGIQLNFAGGERTRAISFFAIALSAGAVIGQILGGILISADIAGLEWRPIFLVNVPIGAAAIAAGLRYLPADPTRIAIRVDVLGSVVLAAAALLLVVPLSLGHSDGWPAWTWVSLVASVPMIAAFGAVERRAERQGVPPLVNLHAIAARPVLMGLLNLAVTAATYFALLFTLAQYFQVGLGHSALISGLTLVPWVAAFGLAGQIPRRLPVRFAKWAPLAGNLLLTAAYGALGVVSLAGDHDEALLLALLAIGGFGLGVQFSSMLGHVTSSVKPEHAPDISGAGNTMQQIGGALGVAGFGSLYLGQTGAGVTDATHAFGVVGVGLAALALLAAVAAWLAIRTPTVATRTEDAADRRSVSGIEP
jgi:MFS family permease